MKPRYKIVLLILILFLSVEILLRIFLNDELTFPDRPMVYQYDPVVHYTYTPDTYFTLNGKQHYINKQGFIDTDFGKKTKDTLRMAIVGSSSVSGSINLKEYHCFVSQLQMQFTKKQAKVRILNCGVDGDRRSLDIFNMIKYQVIDFNPDIILLEYGLPFCSNNTIRECYRGYYLEYPANNTATFEFGKEMVDQLLRYKTVFDFLYHSYCTRGLVRLYKRHTKAKRTKYKCPKDLLTRYIELYELKNCECISKHTPTQYSMDESIDMVKKMKSELQEQGTRFFLFQYEKEDSVISVARNNKLPLISLGVTLNKDDFFLKDSHWNEQGCRKVAVRFYELMMKYGLIPNHYNEKE